MNPDLFEAAPPWSEARPFVMLTLQRGHDEWQFDEPCIVVCRPSLQSLREGDWSAYENVIQFRPTRRGWKNAWRCARLLALANKGRPVVTTRDEVRDLLAVHLIPSMEDAWCFPPRRLTESEVAA